jgi:hypothetical protein
LADIPPAKKYEQAARLLARGHIFALCVSVEGAGVQGFALPGAWGASPANDSQRASVIVARAMRLVVELDARPAAIDLAACDRGPDQQQCEQELLRQRMP